MATPRPVVFVVGQTASGKTALGLAIARRFGGEIICADSRTVYRGMDIGTAKPTEEERAIVPHHLLDVVNPDEHFSAAEFQRLAKKAIKDVHLRHKLPIVVGGTGLYIDSLLYDYSFLPPADPKERERLQKMSVEELQAEVSTRGLSLPENSKNPRHLQRVLETNGSQSGRREIPDNYLVVGLHVEREELKERIAQRTDAMLMSGLIDEVRELFDQYGPATEALRTPGYKAFYQYIQGSCTMEDATEQFIKNDLALAKRQRTWFRRNNSIHWISEQAETVGLLTSFLNNYRI